MNFDDIPEVRDWTPRYAVPRKSVAKKTRNDRQSQPDGVGQVGIICGVASVAMFFVSILACGLLSYAGIPIALIGIGAAIQSKHASSRITGIILCIVGLALCLYYPVMTQFALIHIRDGMDQFHDELSRMRR